MALFVNTYVSNPDDFNGKTANINVYIMGDGLWLTVCVCMLCCYRGRNCSTRPTHYTVSIYEDIQTQDE